MSWIKAHQSIATNRKILRAAEALNIPVPTMIGHMILIWHWAIENAPGGVLDASPVMIARIAQVTKPSKYFVDALVRAGLLLESADGTLAIVNYDEHIQPILIAGKRHRLAQAELRRKQAAEVSRQQFRATCDPAVDPDCHLMNA